MITYRDYSLRKRLATSDIKVPGAVDAFGKKDKKKEKEALTNAKLQCLEIDIEAPLCTIEWRNFGEVINEVKGLGWF